MKPHVIVCFRMCEIFHKKMQKIIRKRQGLTRSAWISEAIQEKMQREEKQKRINNND